MLYIKRKTYANCINSNQRQHIHVKKSIRHLKIPDEHEGTLLCM